MMGLLILKYTILICNCCTFRLSCTFCTLLIPRLTIFLNQGNNKWMESGINFFNYYNLACHFDNPFSHGDVKNSFAIAY